MTIPAPPKFLTTVPFCQLKNGERFKLAGLIGKALCDDVSGGVLPFTSSARTLKIGTEHSP